jgi:ADP-dependent phosphofructokinase/glucokinase
MPPPGFTVAAGTVGAGEQVLSGEGLLAYTSIQDSYGPDDMTGIFRIDDHVVVIVPTYIAQNVQKTAGLGDILSSTAFVADRF